MNYRKYKLNLAKKIIRMSDKKASSYSITKQQAYSIIEYQKLVKRGKGC